MRQSPFIRPIADTILGSHRGVAVLEGARGVGKTWIARHEFDVAGYAYVNLAQEGYVRSIERDPVGWFAAQGTHVVFDEAQLLSQLPQLAKDAVDQLHPDHPLFILTGSASLDRTGLGGQDPLTRRASRYTLSPLTMREIRGVRANLIDDLWDAEPRIGYARATPRTELYTLMAVGGFPSFVANGTYLAKGERLAAVEDDIEGILRGHLLPDERTSALEAQRLLTVLLGTPGGILNISELSKRLERNSRTISSYLDRLEERFLVYRLQNLKLQPSRQAYSRPKIHPVDTAFSVNAFEAAGRDLLASNEAFGANFESYVVNQILPAAMWSGHRPRAFYWRDTSRKQPEVDLVLMAGGETIGIEVKSSNHVEGKDFTGLRALAEQTNLVRGYVVYTGERLLQQDERLWALPVAALWDESAFERSDGGEAADDDAWAARKTRIQEPIRVRAGNALIGGIPSDANLFLSYNQSDSDYLKGAFHRLIDEVVKRYEFETGHTLSLYESTNAERHDDEWSGLLSQRNVSRSPNIILPHITPRYIRNASNRSEFFGLADACEHRVENRLVPILWQDVSGLDVDGQARKIGELLRSTEAIDARSMQRRSAGDERYLDFVEEMVDILKDLIATTKAEVSAETKVDGNGEREAAQTQGRSSSEMQRELSEVIPVDPSARQEMLQRDFRELLDRARSLTIVGNGIVGSVIAIENLFEFMPEPQSDNPEALSQWIEGASSLLRTPRETLEKLLDDLEVRWGAFRRSVNAYIDDSLRARLTGNRTELLSILHSLQHMPAATLASNDFVERFEPYGGFSPEFHATRRTLMRFRELYDLIANESQSLIDRASALP